MSQYLVVLSTILIVEMLVVCEPVRSTIGAIILVKMLLVCEPSARNVALLGGSSDATFSTFQSQCGSLSSRKSFVSRQVMSPSRHLAIIRGFLLIFYRNEL